MEVRHLDGTPARGAAVILRGAGLPGPTRYTVQASGWSASTRTGEDGVATFFNLPAERAMASVWEPGFLMGDEVAVDLRPGTVARVVVREAAGHPVLLRVLSRAGEPVPGCTVRLDSRYLALDEEGTQTLEPVTGASGQVLLPRVPREGADVVLVRGATSLRVHVGPIDRAEAIWIP